MMRLIGISLMVLSFLASGGRADNNWPQFRGGLSLGTSDETDLPDTWGPDKNVAWKINIPGLGWSSPIVWGDKIVVTSVINEGQSEPRKKGLYFGGERMKPPSDVHQWMVYCLDFNTGKTLWERTVHKGRPEGTHHIKNTFASETPVTDGERIYAYFGNQGLYCLDFEGKELWSRKWDNFKTKFGWGTAASPVVYKDRLYIINDNEEKSFLEALDKKTGKTIWHVDRDEKTNWATPYIWENSQRIELVTPGTGKVRSYDLDGKLLWELKGMSNITIPTPFASADYLFVCSGYVLDKLRPVYAIRPGASGDISLQNGETSNKFVAWSNQTASPYNPSPLLYGDYFYVLRDRGFFSCYDARTGKAMYTDQRLGADAFTTSPWAYNGKIFCLSEDGDTFVIQAGPEFKLLGNKVNKLDEMCMATPAIVRGSLILRTESKLYRFQTNGKAAP
jgi:outer membrane protein assembly factor BamB